MKAQINKLHITVGLPGSGKTTWGKAMAKKGHNTAHLETDRYIHFPTPNATSMKSVIANRMNYYDEVILDGLFLTEKDIMEVILAVIDSKKSIKEVVIQYWEPDREACIWNDMYRREVDSGITISNAVIGDFKNVDRCIEAFPSIKFSIQRHKIVKTKPYVLFANKHEIHLNSEGNYMGSSWCTGGTWRDCWDNSGTVSADAQPEGMRILDDLLEKICPSVSFLQYKKIMNTCVHVDDYSDGDYYGGTTYHNRYVLDVERLYEYLVELELIEIIE